MLVLNGNNHNDADGGDINNNKHACNYQTTFRSTHAMNDCNDFSGCRSDRQQSQPQLHCAAVCRQQNIVKP